MVSFILYWKCCFLLLYPLVLLPIVLLNDKKETRCLYVVVLMIGYWIFDAVPKVITGLIPVILFPPLNILEGAKLSRLYLSSPNILFFGGMVFALAIQRSNLYKKIFFCLIQKTGFSIRKFQLIIFVYSTFLSMWIPNMFVAQMMGPLVETILTDLSSNELYKMQEEDPQGVERPSELTKCLYLSVAYASTIGGIGNLLGSPTNLAMYGVYTMMNPKSDVVTFNYWFATNFLLMLLMMAFTCLFLQVQYLGLFRPSSLNAQAARMESETDFMVKDIMEFVFRDLGPVNFYEGMVAALFLLVVVLSFLRWPVHFSGWPLLITDHKVRDSCSIMFVVFLLFILPSRSDFLHMFSTDDLKRPTAATPPLMVWKYVHTYMIWEDLFILGGSFAITKGLSASKLDVLIVEWADATREIPKFWWLIILTLLAMVVTQFCRNLVLTSSMMPFLPHLAKKVDCHPVYLMMPVCLACSFSFCLPMASSNNRKIQEVCKITKREWARVGSVVMFVSWGLMLGIVPALSPYK